MAWFGHVRHEVVVRVLRDLDQVRAVVERRRPLVRLAADEAVELVEAGARRPAVGRAGDADLPRRRLVVLAVEGGAVAVQPQHLGERRHVVRPLSRVAGERGGRLGDRRPCCSSGGCGRSAAPCASASRRPCCGTRCSAAPPAPGGRRSACGPARRRRSGLPKPMSSIRTRTTFGAPAGGLHLEAGRRRGLADVELRDRRVARLRDRQHGAVERRGSGGRLRRRRRFRPGTGHRDQQGARSGGGQPSLESHQCAPLRRGDTVDRSEWRQWTVDAAPRPVLQDRCRGSGAALVSSDRADRIDLSLRAARVLLRPEGADT